MILPVWLQNTISATLGLLIGSFLNVVIYRVPRKLSVVHPRSQCPSCGHTITWYENIPVLSYLLQGGCCRSCKSSISIRYPVIELLTGLLFLACTVRFGFHPLLFFRDWPFVSILVAITFIDLEHRIIPDRLSLVMILLGLSTSYWVPGLGVERSFIGALFGFGVFYGLAWTYLRITGRSGLGGGDIKLLAALGAYVGLSGVFATILISSVFGSVVGIGWGLLQGRGKLMQLAIPYGPFLVVGALYYYFMGDILWFRFMIPT